MEKKIVEIPCKLSFVCECLPIVMFMYGDDDYIRLRIDNLLREHGEHQFKMKANPGNQEH